MVDHFSVQFNNSSQYIQFFQAVPAISRHTTRPVSRSCPAFADAALIVCHL